MVLSVSAKVYNNTLYKNGVFQTGGRNGTIVFGTDAADNGIVKNNICAENQRSYEIETTADIAGLTCDYNCYYHSAGGNYFLEADVAKDWSGWQTAGYDANGMASDPQMVDPDNQNFKLKSTSPCINAGTRVGLAQDYEGTIVPKAIMPDIGAYEKGCAAMREGIKVEIS